MPTNQKSVKGQPKTIEIVQRRIVGEIEIIQGMGRDPLEVLAEMAMNDAVGTMRQDRSSTSVYEVDTTGTLDMGKVAVTIEHDPVSEKSPMTVEEAKHALNEARRRERDDTQSTESTDSWS